ncbi:MAG: hypothetical protein WA162_08510 [Thermodesulfobacteriota bacterium]
MAVKRKVAFLTVLCAALASPPALYAYINGQASIIRYTTQASSGGVTNSSGSTIEQYGVNFGKAVTGTIAFSGSIQWSDINTDGRKTSSVSPQLSLSFSPPAMYNISFNHTRQESNPAIQDRMTTDNTAISFSLPPSKWPSLNTSFSHSTAQDHKSPHMVDSVSNTMGIGTGYSFLFQGADANVSYGFGDTISINKVGDTETRSPSHSVSFNIGRSFLDNKISAGMTSSYSSSKSITRSTGAPSRFDLSVPPVVGLASYNPASVLVGGLANEAEAIDNDVNTPVNFASLCGGGLYIDLNCADWNVGIGFTNPESIYKIYVYINTTPAVENNIVNNVYNFSWSLYTSPDNIIWTSLGGIAPVYNSLLNRFEFSFTEATARYFKVVNGTGNGVPDDINVTEIQAVGFLLASPRQSVTQTSDSKTGGFGLSYRPTDKLSFGMNMSYSQSGSSVAGQSSGDSTSTSLGASMNYAAIPRYLTIGSSYSRAEQDSDPGAGTGSSGYSLSLSSSPLDTMSASFTLNHSEAEAGGAVTSKSDAESLGMSAMLYRGVDLGLNATMGQGESPSSGVESSFIFYGYNLRLVPRKSFYIVVSGSRSENESKAGGVTTRTAGEALGASFSYAPAGRFYISGNFSFKPAKSQSQSFSATLMPTRTISASLRYSIDQNGAAKTFSSDISWRPINRFFLTFGYSLATIDNSTSDRVQTVNARGSVTF